MGVGKTDPCLDFEPKVGELVGKGVAAGHILLIQVAATHNQSTWMLFYGINKQRNIFRKMLSVAIDGDGIIEAQLLCFPEASFQCIAFASVFAVIDYSNGVAESC